MSISGMSQKLIYIKTDLCGCPPQITCENGGESSKKTDKTFK